MKEMNIKKSLITTTMALAAIWSINSNQAAADTDTITVSVTNNLKTRAPITGSWADLSYWDNKDHTMQVLRNRLLPDTINYFQKSTTQFTISPEDFENIASLHVIIHYTNAKKETCR